ncbi:MULTISPECIES: hypothetical protein [unclassified Nocardioides]|uniref:hypothetical protein n=1 Tax=unclassified Nocardioides TaxID=2615069 RepID=UPI000703B204|nr:MULTISPECIES: hypothetical protein [unclassified Nocardioides]
MTDQLEQDLTALFAQRAAEAEVPPMPPELFAREDRRPGRRVAIALVAAAAAAAVAIPVGLSFRNGDDVQPAPAPAPTDPGVSRGLELPYLIDGRLHVGELVLPTTADSLVVTGTQVLLSTGNQAGGRPTWSRLAGDALEPMPYLDGAYNVTTAYDGSVVAAPVVTGTTTSVRVWDTTTGAVVDTVALAQAPSPEEPWLWGFDDRGRLFWQDGTTQRMRTAAGEVVELETGDLHFGGITPGAVVLLQGQSSRTAQLAEVADDGTVRDTSEVPVSTAAAWRDHDTMAYEAVASGLVNIYDVATGEQQPVDVGDGALMVAGWSGDELVVVQQVPRGSRVVAYDPETREQRTVFEFGLDQPFPFASLDGTGAL